MKIKMIFIVIIAISFFIFSPISFAHPGNTSSDGCHYCWTNCAKWGVQYGVRHCHNGVGIPSCSFNSSYSYSSNSCECWRGYIPVGNSCTSGYTYCTNKFGFGATYDYLSDSCECSSGYVYDSTTGSCQSGSLYCSNKLGFGSRYNSLSNSCECGFGYLYKYGRCQFDW